MSDSPPEPIDLAACPLPIAPHDTIQMGHGAGGRMTQSLISRLFRWAFDNEALNKLDDMAVVPLDGSKLSVSTDSFVVDPIFFPGGDIGELAVYGTVNDVAMAGARPVYLTAAFIIEEGLPLTDLTRVVISMRDAARRCDVTIITGDTKVVPKGKGDKLFITTTGIGVVTHPHTISGSNLQPGDKLILSGSIAEHGMAVLSKREGMRFEIPVESDAANLHPLVCPLVRTFGAGIHAMRDATRGGVAAVLNEFAAGSKVGIRIQEQAIPILPAVASACGMLGLDPLYVANEGKMLLSVAADRADQILTMMRAHPLGKNAAIIGDVVAGSAGLVSMQTLLGSWRIVDVPLSEQLPRIC